MCVALLTAAGACVPRHPLCSTLLHSQLKTLPEAFFKGHAQLKRINIKGSGSLGLQKRLPDGLLEGLVSLVELDLSDCGYQNLPNLADLQVCVVSHLSE